jgi:AraC-like DNA-binding protein
MPHLIRGACLTGYGEVARSLGLDPFALAREAGVDRAWLADPDIKIPVEAPARLLEMSAAAAGVEDFGLRMAETRSISNLGPVALAVRDMATVREAVEAAIRYVSLHNEALLVALEATGDVVIFKCDLLAERRAFGRQAIELVVGVAHRLVRQLSGGAWRSCPVWFSHGPPADMASHLRLFGPWVEFGRDCNGVVLEARDLGAPLPVPDPAMARHVKQYLEPLLATREVSLVDQVRRLIGDGLASHRASNDQVASRLGMTRRTLHRRLAREGETFAAIVNAVRVDLARRHIDDRGLPLSEVAHRLGFSELSGFSRWFRGQFGCSPMSWRQARRLRADSEQPAPSPKRATGESDLAHA